MKTEQGSSGSLLLDAQYWKNTQHLVLRHLSLKNSIKIYLCVTL